MNENLLQSYQHLRLYFYKLNVNIASTKGSQALLGGPVLHNLSSKIAEFGVEIEKVSFEAEHPVDGHWKGSKYRNWKKSIGAIFESCTTYHFVEDETRLNGGRMPTHAELPFTSFVRDLSSTIHVYLSEETNFKEIYHSLTTFVNHF